MSDADDEAQAQFEDWQARRALLRALVQARRTARVTQRQMADALGIRQSAVSQMENGDDFRLSTVQRYARALGLVLKATVEQAGNPDEPDEPDEQSPP